MPWPRISASRGDLTTDTIVPPEAQTQARVVAREAGRVAGLEIALEAFGLFDDHIVVECRVEDGHDVKAGTVLAEIRGPARGILTAERTALNLLGRLCGIATVTRGMASAVAPHGAKIVCTRKTTPTLRALEKYAVRCGGGFNHRFGLDDAILIKDNHLAVAGSVRSAVSRAASIGRALGKDRGWRSTP